MGGGVTTEYEEEYGGVIVVDFFPGFWFEVKESEEWVY